MYDPFQSTRPRGARPADFDIDAPKLRVSIHAPARGATLSSYDIHTLYDGFNPRARAGRDYGIDHRHNLTTCFNPRARAGRDAIKQGNVRELIQFQSTRPRGARHPVGQSLAGAVGFQSTRPRGARHGFRDYIGRESMFQSTRPRGARQGRRSCPLLSS